jgi:Ca-activated chloride channel family protein
MKPAIKPSLSDIRLDARQSNSQRQLSLELSAQADFSEQNLALNLCLILDRSGSMEGTALETVKQAAISIIRKLTTEDRLSVITFNHRAEIIVRNQLVGDLPLIERQIETLTADGGTAIDEGMRLGIKEVAAGRQNCVSKIFLLTDGENEHGDNQRCLKLAELASEYSIAIDTLGFGEHWNQDVLEKISDSAGGTLAYIEKPEQALSEFSKLFDRAQAVGLTNVRLMMELTPGIRLANLKPVAQVAPETIELPISLDGNYFTVRLGDLMKAIPRVVLVNLYINQLALGIHKIASVQLCYDDPALSRENIYSEIVDIEVESVADYQPLLDAVVQKSLLTLAKYRQTQIAEVKLKTGDRLGAATMLQTAAKTALQLGDKTGATVLQENATRLQTGEELSQSDRKKTRLASKTILQPNE